MGGGNAAHALTLKMERLPQARHWRIHRLLYLGEEGRFGFHSLGRSQFRAPLRVGLAGLVVVEGRYTHLLTQDGHLGICYNSSMPSYGVTLLSGGLDSTNRCCLCKGPRRQYVGNHIPLRPEPP